MELAAAILDEAARAGVHTEFLVPASVATGVGWGLCQLLAGLLDCTIAHLKVSILGTQGKGEGATSKLMNAWLRWMSCSPDTTTMSIDTAV